MYSYFYHYDLLLTCILGFYLCFLNMLCRQPLMWLHTQVKPIPWHAQGNYIFYLNWLLTSEYQQTKEVCQSLRNVFWLAITTVGGSPVWQLQIPSRRTTQLASLRDSMRLQLSADTRWSWLHNSRTQRWFLPDRVSTPPNEHYVRAY